MLDLKNLSCSMLVPRCLKQALVNYSPLRPLDTIWGTCKKWPNVYLNECMCIVSYDSADIQKQDKNNSWRSNKHS